ncbi:MAG: hypothetical protein RLZZ242_755 [Bacteroidota bacterium]|jgi:hypothetical protein
MKINIITYARFIALLCFFPLLAQGQYWSSFRVDTLGYSTDVRLKEISGLRSSKLNANRFWVHNDSGDAPKIYALSSSMKVEREFLLKGAQHIDWEDMAGGTYHGKPYLFIGDIGDNAARRASIVIYRVEEPEIDHSAQLAELLPTAIELIYPDGPRDAEALLFDERSEELLIVTKRDEKARVYAIDLKTARDDESNTLEFIGVLKIDPLPQDLPPMRRYFHYITAADQHENGSVLIKNYFRAWLYANPEKKLLKELLVSEIPTQLPYNLEQQGEAMAFDLEGVGYYTTSECADDGTTHIPQPLVYYRPN